MWAWQYCVMFVMNKLALIVSCFYTSLTSSTVLLTDSAILTGVVLTGFCPVAALVDPKHSPTPWPCPLFCVTHSNLLLTELQVIQAASEISQIPVDLRCRVLRMWGKEEGAMGAQHAARLGQGDVSWMLMVQGQPQEGGIDLQQDAVPVAIWNWIRSDLQWAGGDVSTAVPEVQFSIGHLRKANKKSINDKQAVLTQVILSF